MDLGVDVRVEVWDDPRVDSGQYELTVVRSCWDYHEDRERFLAWARAVDHLANPVGVLAWNTDKHYLIELARHGIRVVPTTWLESGWDADLPTRGRWVLKPAVSLAGLDTGVYDAAWPEQRAAMRSDARGCSPREEPSWCSLTNRRSSGTARYR